MKYVENGVPEDFARLTFEGLNVPLCELTEEEYMWLVFGIKGYVKKEEEVTKSIFRSKRTFSRQMNLLMY